MGDLQQMFNTLKAVLKEHEPPFIAKMDDESHYDLWRTPKTHRRTTL